MELLIKRRPVVLPKHSEMIRKSQRISRKLYETKAFYYRSVVFLCAVRAPECYNVTEQNVNHLLYFLNKQVLSHSWFLLFNCSPHCVEGDLFFWKELSPPPLGRIRILFLGLLFSSNEFRHDITCSLL